MKRIKTIIIPLLLIGCAIVLIIQPSRPWFKTLRYLIFIFSVILGISLYFITESKKKKISPQYNINTVLMLIISGRVSDWCTILILFLYTGVFFNWIPGLLKEHKYWESASLFALCIDGFLYLFYIILKKYPRHKKVTSIYPEKRKVLIRAISFNKRGIKDREEYLKALQNSPCENLINNKNLDKEIFNLGPLFKAIYYHFSNGPLEKVCLLVSESLAIANDKHPPEVLELNKKILKTLKEKIEKCVGKCEIEFVGEKEGLDFESYSQLRKTLLELLEKIQRKYSTSEITVDISGGTSVVSAVLILIAIKGNIQAQYISQKDPQVLKVIDTDVLEIGDLLEELIEKINIKG
ncbi:MAG: hypothetical protein GXO57_06585 [Thermodesulfobacteria bacterium]|nr:hypothetical protein [Thermodesulfobacteriota bacterium]